jgi:ABC-type nitrate/sulfonate/bicarbonate transport system substrate-binding protein
MRILTRRKLLSCSVPAIAAVTAARGETPRRLRIGFQKNGILVVARQQQVIEHRLQPYGVAVDWTEFSFGPPMLEALRLGSLDFGTVGDTPPIFAQAAHADLLYVAVMHSGSSSAASLLPPGSTLQSLADLKGKRVAFARGSAAQGERLDTRLWTGAAALTGARGNTTSLVGTPQQVAEALLDYYDLGVTTFLIRGFDHPSPQPPPSKGGRDS